METSDTPPDVLIYLVRGLATGRDPAEVNGVCKLKYTKTDLQALYEPPIYKQNFPS